MSVRLSSDGGVGRLVLADPPLNLLTRALLAALRDGLAELSADRTLRVAVLAAEGPHFSAGASVPEHLPPAFETLIPEFSDTLLRLATFPLPLLAAVRGRCLGGGFEVALAADIVVAGQGATLGLPEIGLGVFPPAACALLPGRAPQGAVAELLFTGDPIDAHAALAAGLVHRVVADADIEAAADRIARRIARNSAAALRAAKAAWVRSRRGLWQDRLDTAERVYVDELMTTADALEGLRAFMEKRQPAWSHR
jgi:cyclohexa-1,5-dienecarbonyl-CoA hydratase